MSTKKIKVMRGMASALVLVSMNAVAWNYSVGPVVRSTMRGDDNIRGATKDKEAAWGFDNTALVDMRATTDTISSTLIPRMNLRRFVIGEDLDADEYGVVFNNLWNTERVRYELDFNYSRDSTLSTEATDTGGRQNTVVDRDGITVNPTITYLFSDRLMLEVGYLFNTVSYLTQNNADFVDYDYQIVNSDLTYQWRENIQLFASISFSYFDAGSGFSITRSYSGRAGGTYHWDETLEFTGTVGWVDSNVKFQEQRLILVPVIAIITVPAHGASNGPLASVSILKKFDQATAKFDYVRQVSPSGRGAQSNNDRISGTYAYRFTDRFNAQADFVYDMQTADGATFAGSNIASSLNRDYLEFVGTVRYKLTPEWQLSTAYHHPIRKSTSNAFSATAEGNSLYFSVEYTGDRINF